MSFPKSHYTDLLTKFKIKSEFVKIVLVGRLS
jgi:hypothetical protein